MFFRWMLRKRVEYSKAIENMLQIFDVIGFLTANKLSKDIVEHLGREAIDLLVKRTGLVPPSECTITMHELLHVISQSHNIGCPRFSNLYKFERVNKSLKSTLKNVARGFASIMKNYMQKEGIFLETAVNLGEIETIDSLQKFCPKDLKSMKNLKNYLNKLYIDYTDENQIQLFDVECSNIVQLFGEKRIEKLNILLFSYLLCNALEYPDSRAPDDSLLKRLYDEWKAGPGSKKPEAFFNFLQKSFNKFRILNPQTVYMRYQKIIFHMKDVELKDIFQKDFNFLVEAFNINDDTGENPMEFLFVS